MYLYERMAGTEVKQRDQTNYVYEKRIKSYLQFLWKGMLAHNVYMNLDIASPQISIKRLKAYVGFGNNCNMIKGLVKRRFWWTVTEEMKEDCLFVWTQLKVNKIYSKQEKGTLGRSVYNLLDKDQDRRNLIKTSSSNRKRQTIQIRAKDKGFI